MDTSQTQPEAARTNPMQSLPGKALTELLRLLQQPTRMPLPGGNHVRASVTKNKSLGESKARQKMAKASRQRNRNYANR